MAKATTPFWWEGMTTAEQARQEVLLFELLDQQLVVQLTTPSKSPMETFVFVPDPAPLPPDRWDLTLKPVAFSWGKRGVGMAVGTRSEAIRLTPQLFDLRSDQLYVMLFKTRCPTANVLQSWVESLLLDHSRETTGSRSAAPRNVFPPLPPFALLLFDWGDLVLDTGF